MFLAGLALVDCSAGEVGGHSEAVELSVLFCTEEDRWELRSLNMVTSDRKSRETVLQL